MTLDTRNCFQLTTGTLRDGGLRHFVVINILFINWRVVKVMVTFFLGLSSLGYPRSVLNKKLNSQTSLSLIGPHTNDTKETKLVTASFSRWVLFKRMWQQRLRELYH